MRSHLPALGPALARVPTAVRTHPRASVGFAALVLTLLLGGVVGVLVAGSGEQRPPAAAPAAPTSGADNATPGVDTTQDASYARARPGYPDRVIVPALDVDAPVLPIRAPDRTLTPPADPQVLGWWVDGARPGAPSGSALVVGHTVSSGGGALDELETLTSGDEITVRSTRRSGGEDVATETRYAVESVEVYRKGTLAARAAELFSQEVEGRLVLLTCEEWNGSRYLSNVVVTALPVEGTTAQG